jgi:signal peptidase I
MAETLALSLVAILLIQYFAAQPYRVQESSMEDTLSPDEYVLVDKLSPNFVSYHRGDIIVFNPPSGWATNSDTPFVKRIIGLGGDTVDIHDGYVWVNGLKLVEDYVFKGDTTKPVDQAHHTWTVKPGQLFVLGDHRSVSQDSRSFGPIDQSAVIGRALFRYWPLDKLGAMPPAKLPPIPTAAP